MINQNILLIENDQSIHNNYVRFCASLGFTTQTVQNTQQAESALKTDEFYAILLDLNLPDIDSIQWISTIKLEYPSILLIVITEKIDVPTVVKAMKNGADDFLMKPTDFALLKHRLTVPLKSAIAPKQISTEVIDPQQSPYFGKDPITTEIVEYAKIAALSNNVVLLLGDTGTGKGVIARWIHEHSNRKSGPFVEVNCSCLKGDLLRSELLGHAKGSFTSAIKDKPGLLEVADSGTLFLDEIGDMALEVQTQLLKTLEERTFRRLGENVIRTSNFRLICATNQDLLASGPNAFRSDLYYRISVFPINLLGLNNRPDEIKGLCQYFMKSLDCHQQPINGPLLKRLQEYSWPGNVRELKNMLERASMLAQGSPFTLLHFPTLVSVKNRIQSFPMISMKLDDVEDAHIQRIIDYYSGNIPTASKALGLSESSLYRRLSMMRIKALA